MKHRVEKSVFFSLGNGIKERMERKSFSFLKESKEAKKKIFTSYLN